MVQLNMVLLQEALLVCKEAQDMLETLQEQVGDEIGRLEVRFMRLLQLLR